MRVGSTRGKSRVTVQRVGNASRVRVIGAIDDTFDHAFIEDLVDREVPVVFDLDKVDRISSFGVREWMRALAAVPSKTYYFVRCRSMLVAQFNSVQGFGGRGRIVSLYSPYLCPDCDHFFELLLDVRRDDGAIGDKQAQAVKCPECGAAAEFDDFEDSYFDCVSGRPPLQLEQAVIDLIDGPRADLQRPLRAHKEIVEDLTVLWLVGRLDGKSRLRRYAAMLEGRLLLMLPRAAVGEEAGLKRLQEVLGAGEAEVFLARVPIEIASALSYGEGGFGKAQVVSVVHRVECVSCGELAEADITRWTKEPTERPPRCSSCEAPLPVAWTPELAQKLASMPLCEAPLDVAAYLMGHREPVSFQSDKSDPQTTPTGPGPTFGVRTQVGKYEILSKLGEGGMAEVFLGRQRGPEGFEKKVVIKHILPHLAARPEFVLMFQQEARIAARLSHSHVVQIYDLAQEGDDHYIVMEYVRGADLNRVLRTLKRVQELVPPAIACRIIADVCGGLHAAHSFLNDSGVPVPILHRDVSPHNIIVALDGMAKLADFGVAKATDSLPTTQTGALKGKIIYTAPEQITGAEPDARIDIFALGLVLYQCLTGVHPYQRESEVLTLHALLDQEAPDPRTLQPNLPAELARIVMRAIAKKPAERYARADLMQADLETFLAGTGLPTANMAVATWLRALLDLEPLFDPDVRGDDTPGGDDATTMTTPGRFGDGGGTGKAFLFKGGKE